MISAQLYLRLSIIKGHTEMCSFCFIRGLGTQIQSVSGVTTICLVQCNTSSSHRVYHIWLVHSSSMAVQNCWILGRTGTRCRIRRSSTSQTCSTFNAQATDLVDTLSQCWYLAAFCSETKLQISEWPFIVDSLRYTYALIMVSDEHLDVAHLWGGMDYLNNI